MTKRRVPKDMKKQQRIKDLLATGKAKGFPEVQTIIPRQALPKKYTQDDVNQLLSNVTLFGVHRWYIGRVDLPPPNTAVGWDGVKCQDRWEEYYGNLSHPDLEKILGDVNACMEAALAAAVAAGVFTGNLTAASAAFTASLVACLKSKGIEWASEISMWVDPPLYREGDWHWCTK